MTLHRSLPSDEPKLALHRLTATLALGAAVIRDLMRTPPERADDAITAALARLAGAGGWTRGFLCIETAPGAFVETHAWRADPLADLTPTPPPALATIGAADLARNLPLAVSDTMASPRTSPLLAALVARGIRSVLALPLGHEGALSGFVGFESAHPSREFLEGEVHAFQSVADIIAALLARRDTDQQVARVRAARDLECLRLHATLRVLPDLLLELDHRLIVTAVHANSRIGLPVDPAALLNRRITDHLPPGALAVVDRIKDDLARSDISVGNRLELARNGASRWLALSAAHRPAEGDGTPPGYVVIARDITEAHHSRIEVERLGQIARNTTNLIVITNRAGQIEWVNPAFETRTGYRLDEARGKTPGKLLQCPQTDRRTIEAIAQALRDLRPITCEILNRTRGGEDYWVELSIQPMRNLAGEVTGFMSVQTDMTQHHLTQQSLERALAAEKSAREQLRSAVGIMQDAFVQFDAEQRLVLCNRRYRDLYPEIDTHLEPGTPLATILRAGVAQGCFDTESMPPEDWIEAELRGFPLHFTQSGVVQRHGQWYRLTKQRTPDGGRMMLLSDITDLKNAEERALAERAQAMDASHDGITMLSMTGEVLYANAAAARIFGRAGASAVIGAHWRHLLRVSPEIEAKAQAALADRGFWQGQVQAVRGSEAPLEIEVSATRNGTRATLCILRDLSERLRVQAEQDRLRTELELAQRREEVGQIAAGLTHDFNNLLAAISAAASLIEEIAGDDSKALAESIGSAVDQASRLVRRLMSLGKRSGAHQDIDLRIPLRDAVELVQPSLRPPVGLDLHLPAEPMFAHIDQTAVMQLVLNLVINARDALAQSAGEARITVELATATGDDLRRTLALGAVAAGMPYARILVADTGPGMDAATRAQIFSSYFSTKGEKGTGLGLPIVASAVRAHHGALSLTTAPGEGAHFCILLPLHAPDDQGAADADTAETEDRGAQAHPDCR